MSIIGGSVGSSGGGLPGTDTSDATAAATDIITPKTAYGSAGTKLTGTALDPSTRTAVAADLAIGKTAISAGGALTGTGVYSPAMMQFDGSTGYYSASLAPSVIKQRLWRGLTWRK